MTEEDWTRPVRRATRCHGSEFMTSRKQSDNSKHRIKARAAQLLSQGTLFTTTLTALLTKEMFFFFLILIQSFYLFSEIRFFFLSSLNNLKQRSRSWKCNTTLGWTINTPLSWNQKAHYQAHKSVPASDASSPQTHNPLNLLFNYNSIYPSTSMSTKWPSLHVWDYNFTCISYLTHACYINLPPQRPLWDQAPEIWPRNGHKELIQNHDNYKHTHTHTHTHTYIYIYIYIHIYIKHTASLLTNWISANG